MHSRPARPAQSDRGMFQVLIERHSTFLHIRRNVVSLVPTPSALALFSRKEFVVAVQKSDKGNAQNNKSGNDMNGMISKVCSVTAVVLGALFFAAAFDLGHIGLMQTVQGLAIALVPLFAMLALAAVFMSSASATDAEAQTQQIATLNEFRSKITSQIITLQDQLDSLSSQDNETLKARNAELQAQLDEIHQVERDKVDSEIEALRQRNEELEAQIKKWAFDAVGKTMSGQQVQPMKAA